MGKSSPAVTVSFIPSFYHGVPAMPRNHRARSVLARAAFGAIHGTGVYCAKAKPAEEETDEEGEGGGGGDAPKKLEITEQELQDRIQAATAEAIKADRAERKKKEKQRKRDEEQAESEDEDEEDPREIISAAEQRAADAEQRAAEAEKKATMADVGVRLRDYLTANYKEFIGNAPDIILHIERALSAAPKEQEIIRLIEAQSKAFVERTKTARGNQNNQISASRSKLTGTNQQAQQGETRTITRTDQPESRPRFSTINWHG
jgi:hypothetical protein